MRVWIRDHFWTVVFSRMRKNYGLCHWDSRKIELSKFQDQKELLGTATHEVLHACFPDATEAAIDESSVAICEVLWRLGFRREGA